MRFSEEDLFCNDIRWFAIDKNGYVFSCTSAGTFNVPEFVCKSQENTCVLENFFLFSSEFSNLDIKIEKFSYELDYDLIGEEDVILLDRGISSFDSIIKYETIDNEKDFEIHPYWYKKLTFPKKPLHFNQLPKNIQNIMNYHKIQIDSRQIKYFFVPPIYKE